MSVTVVEPAALGIEEIRAAILSFDAPTQLRLEQAAARFSDGRGIDPDDLLHDAVVKCLEGERICPRNVPVATFVWNTMRSLASSSLKTRNRSKVDPNVDVHEDNVVIENEDREPSPEDDILNREKETQFVNAMDALFADDPEAQLVLAGLCQEMTPEDIQRECELSATAYNTIRRRIRRRYNKHYPKGWQL